jgi:hypothetical protein
VREIDAVGGCWRTTNVMIESYEPALLPITHCFAGPDGKIYEVADFRGRGWRRCNALEEEHAGRTNNASECPGSKP